MRIVILGMSALVAIGVFAAMFLSIWSTRRASATSTAFRQSLATELAWAAIPCLITLAAATPAVIAMVSGGTGN